MCEETSVSGVTSADLTQPNVSELHFQNPITPKENRRFGLKQSVVTVG